MSISDPAEEIENQPFYEDIFTVGPVIVRNLLPSYLNNFGQDYRQPSDTLCKEQCSLCTDTFDDKEYGKFLEILRDLGPDNNPFNATDLKQFISKLHKKIYGLKITIFDFLKFNKQRLNKERLGLQISRNR